MYKIVEREESFAIVLDEFPDNEITVSGIRFVEHAEEDYLEVKIEYTSAKPIEIPKTDFDMKLGTVIMELIESQQQTGELIYKGGIDEN